MITINEHSSKKEVLVEVENDGLALQYASAALKNDRKVVLEVIRRISLKKTPDHPLVHLPVHLKKTAKELAYNFKRLSDISLKKNERELALEAVRRDGWILRYAPETLKLNKDILFFWAVWHIEKCKENDEDRKKYVADYILEETVTFLCASGLAVVSGLFLGGVIAFSAPALANLIAAALIEAICGIYTIQKIVQHTHGFFKARAEKAESPNPRPVFAPMNQ
jgi:hypothetical protein